MVNRSGLLNPEDTSLEFEVAVGYGDPRAAVRTPADVADRPLVHGRGVAEHVDGLGLRLLTPFGPYYILFWYSRKFLRNTNDTNKNARNCITMNADLCLGEKIMSALVASSVDSKYPSYISMALF